MLLMAALMERPAGTAAGRSHDRQQALAVDAACRTGGGLAMVRALSGC